MSHSASENNLVSLSEIRKQKGDELRRKNERLFFNRFLSVFCVLDEQAMAAVEIIDVSANGLSFQVPFRPDAKSLVGEQLTLRFYFNSETYLPVVVDIKNSRPLLSQMTRFTAYGCSIESKQAGYDAWTKFIDFLGTYGAMAATDYGDRKIAYF